MNEKRTPAGIERAIAALGNQTVLATRLGVTQQAISSWRRRGWVPTMRADEIAQISGVPARDLLNPRLAQMLAPKVA